MPQEEQVQELAPVTFAEINQQHEAGDFHIADAPIVQDKTNESAAPDKTATHEKTNEEVVDWQSKYKDFEATYTKEKESYLKEINDHKIKISEYEKKPPPLTHKNSDYSKLEILNETAPEKVPLFQKLLWGNPNAQDLWKMDFLEKNPEFKDKPDMVEDLLHDAFSAYFDPEADPESREYKVAAAKLEIAGNQIKGAKLAEFKAIQVPDSQEAVKVNEQKKQELAKSWEIPFSELTKTAPKVAQKIVLDDKSEIDVDFDVTAEDAKSFHEKMGLFILHNDLKPTAENAEKAKNYAMGEIIREKFSDILKVTFQKELDKRYAEWQKSRNNNRPIGTPGVQADGKKSVDQTVLEMLEHGETHVPNT